MKNEEDKLPEFDHRRLGQELGLFAFSDTVGKGLPLWTEKGATIRRELERFIVDEEIRRGYKHVCTPDIAKLDLYKKSGHYPYYQETMYPPLMIDEEQFMLRPMTCPHHFELYLSSPHSYRELPLRIAELAKLYRYELSGVLTGLIRTRSFCLADAHIICADENQATTEVQGALDLISFAMGTLGFQKGEDFWYRLSLGNRADDQKFYKDDAAWDRAEEILRQTLKRQDVPFKEGENEAAFYGPKIDIQMKEVRGKEETVFTVQYDFVMPKRFKLTYINSRGQEQETIVIHRSSIGSIERVVAFLIEKYHGAFPLWLAPVQAIILPIGEKHNVYAQKVFSKLRDAGIRAEINLDNETLGKKIKIGKTQKIPYLIVIGDKEIASQTLTVEGRTEKFDGLTLSGLITKLQMEIKEKK
mgnify:CR=1 FL=1